MKGLELALQAGDVLEEVQGIVDGHFEQIVHILASIGHLQGLAIVALARAYLARNIDVGKEVHFDLLLAIALASLATTT